jgi:hypothetical protein
LLLLLLLPPLTRPVLTHLTHLLLGQVQTCDVRVAFALLLGGSHAAANQAHGASIAEATSAPSSFRVSFFFRVTFSFCFSFRFRFGRDR